MNGTAIVEEIVMMKGIEIAEETEKEIVMKKETTGDPDHVLGAGTEDTREGVLDLGKYLSTK
jgi:hypothetical protein